MPPAANVQVVNGDSSGEVVVSWDEVAGASGYTNSDGEYERVDSIKVSP